MGGENLLRLSFHVMKRKWKWLYSPWNSPGHNTGMGRLSLPPGDLPNPEIEPRSLTLHVDSLPAEPQFSSVTQSCPTLCDPMNCSMPGILVHHQLPEFTQTHVHWAGDAIQPYHPLSSPSLPAFYLSQHQGLFKWLSSCACFGSTYTKIGTIQRLAWPLRKDDTQIREVFHIFLKHV